MLSATAGNVRSHSGSLFKAFYAVNKGCGLGLDIQVSRQSQNVPMSCLGLILTKNVNILVWSRSPELTSWSRRDLGNLHLVLRSDTGNFQRITNRALSKVCTLRPTIFTVLLQLCMHCMIASTTDIIKSANKFLLSHSTTTQTRSSAPFRCRS